ncbi:hypothetical protein J500_2828 [Acinetobacter sp. 479375]|nr:hypothetical protein J500_2828 [Acinetobacter sp. 479375]
MYFKHVHGDIRHLEIMQDRDLPFQEVHGDIRHLENKATV